MVDLLKLSLQIETKRGLITAKRRQEKLLEDSESKTNMDSDIIAIKGLLQNRCDCASKDAKNHLPYLLTSRPAVDENGKYTEYFLMCVACGKTEVSKSFPPDLEGIIDIRPYIGRGEPEEISDIIGKIEDVILKAAETQLFVPRAALKSKILDKLGKINVPIDLGALANSINNRRSYGVFRSEYIDTIEPKIFGVGYKSVPLNKEREFSFSLSSYKVVWLTTEQTASNPIWYERSLPQNILDITELVSEYGEENLELLVRQIQNIVLELSLSMPEISVVDLKRVIKERLFPERNSKLNRKNNN